MIPRALPGLLCALLLAMAGAAGADEALSAIGRAKAAIVGIGSFQKVQAPSISFIGSGFVVGDGSTVITAAHVVDELGKENGATLGILISLGDTAQFRAASVVAIDHVHDLAQLRFAGAPLPALQLGDSAKVVEGQNLAFTGFPLGMVLGLHHVTHRGMVSAITPVAMPASGARKLDSKLLAQLQRSSYAVFQLDGTAYPGSSGSPLYDTETGLVYGVINMVYVKGLKEAAISNPSGISYAIPSNFVRALIRAPQQ